LWSAGNLLLLGASSESAGADPLGEKAPFPMVSASASARPECVPKASVLVNHCVLEKLAIATVATCFKNRIFMDTGSGCHFQPRIPSTMAPAKTRIMNNTNEAKTLIESMVIQPITSPRMGVPLPAESFTERNTQKIGPITIVIDSIACR
jgi:hypothetical protein